MTYISENEHRRVLATGQDVPDRPPSFAIPLSSVGIANKTVWPLIGREKPIRSPFTASITVDLGRDRRGIHMSRMEQAISDLHQKVYDDLTAYGVDLCRMVRDGQKATHATVELEGSLPLLSQTPVSKKTSVDTVRISCRVLLSDTGKNQVTVRAGLHHLTACPCTQVYNQELFKIEDAAQPMATHSQRSFTTLGVTVAQDRQPPSHTHLIECLTTALHPAQDLLKRPDEAELVIAAHNKPQFAEDAVRETARAVAEKLAKEINPESMITIESLSLESIHIHDVVCRLQTSIADITRIYADNR